MKKLLLLFSLCICQFLFSQEAPATDSLTKMAQEYFKIKTLQQSDLKKSPQFDSSNLDEIRLMGWNNNYGKSVPDFKARTLNGRSYSSDMLKGKVTFINFWFENCQPCIAEFGALNELYKRFKDNKDFQFLSFTWEKKDNALRVARQYGLEYPVLCISEDSCRKLIDHVMAGYPSNVIVDKEGKIQFSISGGPAEAHDARIWEQFIFVPLLEELLGNKP